MPVQDSRIPFRGTEPSIGRTCTRCAAQKTRLFANENLIDKKHFKANPDVRLSLPFFVLAVGRFAYAAARSACKASVPTANVSTERSATTSVRWRDFDDTGDAYNAVSRHFRGTKYASSRRRRRTAFLSLCIGPCRGLVSDTRLAHAGSGMCRVWIR